MRKPDTAAYRDMLLVRRFEERVRELRLAGDIVGSVHLCNGQEAIPVGSVPALNLPVDLVGATYRGHGWALMCGIPPAELFAELLGRAGGVNRGRGGSAYLSAPQRGFIGENSIVGAGAPIACGAALAGRFDGSNRVVATVFGDGAVNQGALMEAFNFAVAKSIPVVFICENNGWSELTPISAMVGDDRLVNRARAFGMEAARIDGNSPAEVSAAMEFAVTRARGGGGPFFIEAMTERLVGHYIGDPEVYRTDEDRERLVAQDPIPRERNRLRVLGIPVEELDRIEQAVQEVIDMAYAQAAVMPEADSQTALEHVYA